LKSSAKSGATRTQARTARLTWREYFMTRHHSG
jgi:hypothetical protein